MFIDQSTDITERMLEMMNQLRREQQRIGEHLAGATHRYLDRLLVPHEGRTLFVRVTEIEWIEAAHNHVLVYVGAKSLRMRESLGALAVRLDPYRFVRIHRSTIVNIDHVAELQPWFGGDSVVLLRSGKKLRVSRSHRNAWERWLSPGTRRTPDWSPGEDDQ